MYYLHKDFQNNYQAITDEQGTLKEELSFDPWGRRRNPTNWTFNDVPDNYLFDRGYTGHEHLDNFSLINMNGRVYDPFLGRFLSPDNFVQESANSQNFNRYSYCLNNPLVYTDPDGEFFFIFMGAALYTSFQIANGNVNGMGDFAISMGIGLAAGAAGAWAGGAVAGAVSTGGFLGGAASGASGGFVGGFVGGSANAWFNGASLLQGFEQGIINAGIGAIAGGLIGGTIAGIDAVRSDANFCNGHISESGGYEGPGRFLEEEIPAGAKPTETGEIATLPSNDDYGKYGMTRSYANGDPKPHFGVDYVGKVGDKVNAMYDGQVIRVGLGKAYGPNAVRTQSVINGRTYNVDYGHLSKSLVLTGDKVSAGTSVIGYMGKVGIPSYAPPHVHIAVWRPLPNGLMGFVMPHF